MCEDNFSKLEVKADITKPIETALTEPLNSSSNIITTVLDFFHNTVLYPLQKYNLYAKNKLYNYAKELENRVKQIPEENLIHPRVNILGPAIDGLKYNLDEEYIKEMFTNILVSDMNNKKQNKVLPAYIEIIKQISQEDALFLKNFANLKINVYALDIIKYDVVHNSSIPLGKELALSENEIIKLNDIVIDNLERLNILKIYDDRYITNSPLYDLCFKKVKHKYTNFNPLQISLTYQKAILKITDFGKNFIDICLS